MTMRRKLAVSFRRLLAPAALLFWFICPALPQSREVWEPIGPSNGTVFALTGDPFDPETVYAGTYFGGIYRSPDGGRTWTAVPSPFTNRSVFTLALDPKHRGTMYAGTFQAGVFKTENGGDSWTGQNAGLTDLNVQSIAVDPFDSDVVLAASGAGLFRSADGGRTWNLASAYALPLTAPINTIAFHPARTGICFLGTPGGAMRSTDHGKTWEDWSTRLGKQSVTALSFGADKTTLYAAAKGGAFSLSDDTGSWQSIGDGLPAAEVNLIQEDPSNPAAIFAVTSEGIFVRSDGRWSLWCDQPARSVYFGSHSTYALVASLHAGLLATADAGVTFTPSQTGMQNLFIGAMAAAQSNGRSVIFAGSDIGVYTLSQDSPEWNNNQRLNQVIFDLQPHPDQSNVLYAGTEKSGVWKSIDFGQTWTQTADGILPATVSAVAPAPDNSGVVYAATDSGLYISRNQGSTWYSAAPIGQLLSIATDPSRPAVAVMGTAAGQVYRTTDYGLTILSGSTGLPQMPIKVLRFAAGGRLFAVTSGGDLFLSRNDGVAWSTVHRDQNDAATTMAVSPANPQIVYLGTQQGGIYQSTNAGVSWTWKGANLPSLNVSSIAVHPYNSAFIYAGTSDGVYTSLDFGDTWSRTASGLPAGAVQTLLFEPGSTTVLYASLNQRGVYRSSDGGRTWASAKRGLPTSDSTPVGADGAMLYAAADLRGIYTSADGGQNWTPSSKGLSLFVRGVAINQKDPNILYAGSLTSGIFKSVNGGETWRSMALRDKVIFKIALDPKTPSNVFAGTSEGILKSSDGAATWKNTGQLMSFIFSMRVDPRDRRILYVGGAGGLFYKSLDSGRTWIFGNAGLPVANIIALALDESTNSLYAAAERLGVYRSADLGLTWAPVTQLAAFSSDIVTSMVVDQDQVLYVATSSGHIYRSVDGGASWDTADAGLPRARITYLDRSAAESGVLYAGVQGNGLFRSLDQGATWTRFGEPRSSFTVFATATHPLRPKVFYAATDAGLLRSDDNGQSWSGVEALTQPVWDIIIDPINPEIVFALTNSSQIYRSDDGGLSWKESRHGFSRSVILRIQRGPAFSGSVYAAALGDGVLRSQDGGDTWSNASTPGWFTPSVLTLAVNPRDSAILYLGTAGTGVLKSVDGGITWSTASNGLDHFSVLALAINPENPDTVYAGSVLGGVFVSDDAGSHWRALREGMFHGNVTSLVVDPVDPRIVYAGTEGGGVFRLTHR